MSIPTYITGRGVLDPGGALVENARVEKPRIARREDITVVIPTYCRDQVLIDTIGRVLDLTPRPGVLLVVDQTRDHAPTVAAALEAMNKNGSIVWLRTAILPSQPAAMNIGLLSANTEFVVFFDDDIIPCRGIIGEFLDTINEMRVVAPSCWCFCGQVIQPGQMVTSPPDRKHRGCFPFNSDSRCFVDDAPAGNLCTDRIRALRIGGFDEAFLGAAYQCDTDFVRRVLKAGGRVLFEPRASIRHIRAPIGGMRVYGDPLRMWKPHYHLGFYYRAIRSGFWPGAKAICWLPIRMARTKFHLRHPWFIPNTLLANYLAIGWALWLAVKDPRLIPPEIVEAVIAGMQSKAVGQGPPCRSSSEGARLT